MDSKYIASRSLVQVNPNDILKLGAIAKKDRAKGNHVIDATIGVFLNDDKTINLVPSVVNALKNHVTDNLGYTPITGNESYKKGLLKWFLKDNYDEIKENYHIPFTATLGGTGALSIAFNLFLEKHNTVLLPNIMWSNYKLIAKKANVEFDTYQLFNSDNMFNIDNLCEKIKEYSKRQKNILVVINDPCQNPTGYSLSSDEYSELIDRLNILGEDVNITVLFDIAYLDYDSNNNEMHRIFKNIISKHLNFLPMFAASCSKIFGMYGLRVGALFSITKDEELFKDFTSSVEAIIRGTYSSPNGPAIDTLANMLNQNDNFKLGEEIYNNTLLLNERTSYFISKLKLNKIKYLPYVNGFFVCVKVNDAFKLCEILKSKHVYLIPIAENLVRIAICSLNKQEIDELIDILKVL